MSKGGNASKRELLIGWRIDRNDTEEVGSPTNRNVKLEIRALGEDEAHEHEAGVFNLEQMTLGLVHLLQVCIFAYVCSMRAWSGIVSPRAALVR